MTYKPYTENDPELCQWFELTSTSGWFQCDQKHVNGEFCEDHLGPALLSVAADDDYKAERDMAVSE